MSKRTSKRRSANKRESRTPSTVHPSALSAKRAAPIWILPTSIGLVALVVAGIVLSRSTTDKHVDALDGERVQISPSTPALDPLLNVAVKLPTLPGLDQQRFDSVVRDVVEREEPALDGWASEQFSALADKQLKLVGQMLADPSLLTEEKAATVAATTFSSDGVRPVALHPIFQDESLHVMRGTVASTAPARGLKGFIAIVKQQSRPLAGLAKTRFKFKIVRVQRQEDVTKTVAVFQFSGRDDKSATQVNSTWNCRWRTWQQYPLLEHIQLENYEEVTYQNPAGGPMFADCTESVFRNSDRFQQQLIFGIDHWTDRFDGAIARPAAGHGIAI